MKVFALYNFKGGVGKTAAAVNLSWLSAAEGYRTLLWDLDPQGAASFHYRVRPKDEAGGRRLLRGKRGLMELVRESDYDRLDLLPADFSLRHSDLTLRDTKDPNGRFRELLEPLGEAYDHLFLDCAPSISVASENIFEAADVLLVPTIPTPLSLRTLAQLMKHLKTKKERRPLILPFFSMVDRRKSIHRRTCEFAREERLGFLEAAIPYSSAVEQMGVRRAPIGVWASSNAASKAYQALWSEVLPQLRHTGGWREGEERPRRATHHSVGSLLDQLSRMGRAGTPPRRAALRVPRSKKTSMPERREIEFKFAVRSEEAFQALADELLEPGAALPAAVRQVNHFFDSQAGDLRQAGAALRLREEQGRFLITAKGPELGPGGDVLTKRAEAEIEIPAGEARRVTAGELSGLALLRRRAREGNEGLLDAMEQALGRAKLRHLGSFENERRRLGPVTLPVVTDADGGDLEVLFELDRTRFPGARVDFEIEVEVDAEEERAARRALEALFERAGIRFGKTTSKAHRFFDSLAPGAKR